MNDKDSKLISEVYTNSRTIKEAAGQFVYLIQTSVDYEGDILHAVCLTLDKAMAVFDKVEAEWGDGLYTPEIFKVPVDVDIEDIEQYKVILPGNDI